MHTCLTSNKRYIGQTSKTMEQRWKQHCWCAKNQPLGSHFTRAIAAYGEDCWQHDVLEEGIQNPEDANAAERKWIFHFRSFEPEKGYNISLGGNSPNRGRELSEEHKAKIGRANKGRKHTEESCRNMSESRKGLKQSAETIAKRVQALTGQTRSDESRQRMRERAKDRIIPQSTCDKMKEKARARWSRTIEQVDIQTQIVVNTFNTIVEAVERTGVSHSMISKCLNGRAAKAGGFIWRVAV